MSKGFTLQMLLDRGYVVENGVARRPDARPGLPAPASGGVVVRPRVQHPKKMTRCEMRFYDHLRHHHPEAKIQPQFRVRITPWGNPRVVHYTADFAIWFEIPGGWRCELWETKDRRRPFHSDEKVRPTMALSENPWIEKISLAMWDGHGFVTSVLATQLQPYNQPTQ